MFAEPDSASTTPGASYSHFNPLDRFFLLLGRAGLDVPALLLLLVYLYVPPLKGFEPLREQRTRSGSTPYHLLT